MKRFVIPITIGTSVIVTREQKSIWKQYRESGQGIL